MECARGPRCKFRDQPDVQPNERWNCQRMAIEGLRLTPQALIGILCNSTLGVRRREHTKALSLHEIIAECFGGVESLSGRVAPALNPRLGDWWRAAGTRAGRSRSRPNRLVLRHETAPVHARGHPPSIAIRGWLSVAQPVRRPPNEALQPRRRPTMLRDLTLVSWPPRG